MRIVEHRTKTMELHRPPVVVHLFTPSKVRGPLVAEPLPEKNRPLLEKLSTRHNEFCHWHLGYVDGLADQLLEVIARNATMCSKCHEISGGAKHDMI